MKIKSADLRRIILEEYISEENITEVDQEEIEKLLQQIQGDKYRSPVQRDPKRYATNDGVTAAMEKPLKDPADDAAVMSGNVSDVIYGMLKDTSPEEVANIFNVVFARLQPEPTAEVPPETLYSPGAEGRPQAGFRLEELKELIREALAEGHYHDMGGEGEMYDVLDPHGIEKMSDVELIDMAEKDGIEDIIVMDGEGDLANREEVIVALKNV